MASVLALVAFVVYNANLRSISSFDTYPTRFLPISIIREGDLDLDEFPFLQRITPGGGDERAGRAYPYYVEFVRGQFMSRYPVMPALLAVPVYVVPVLLGLTDGPPSAMGFTRTEIVGTMLSKLAASAWAALSVAVVYLMLRRLAGGRAAFWLSLVYAFATSTWAVSSQGLWQTSLSQPLLALALYALVRAREEPAGRSAGYAGLALALAVAARPTAVLLAVPLTAYVAHRHRSQLARFVLMGVPVGLLLVAYNLYYFGSLFGAYINPGGDVSAPRLDNLAGLLISPSRGLLGASPVLLPAVAMLGLVLWRRHDLLLVYAAIGSLLTLALYASWSEWDAAFSYSYRYLVDLVPVLMLFLGSAWGWLTAQPWRIATFGALTAWSLLVQVVGSFNYPCGWFETPAQANLQRERFWDWGDPEVLRCLRSGPVDPDGLRFLREVLGGRGRAGSVAG